MQAIVKPAKKKQRMKPIKQDGFKVSAKIDATNENHHIYLNGNVWWMSLFVVYDDSYTKRLRFPLRTRDVQKARKIRDAVLTSFC